LLTINIAFEGKGGQVLKQFTAEEHVLFVACLDVKSEKLPNIPTWDY